MARTKRGSFVPKFIFGTLCVTSVVPACSSGSGTTQDKKDASADASGGVGGLTVAAGGFGGFAVAAGGFGGFSVAGGGFGGGVAAGGFGGFAVAAGGFSGAAGVAAGGFSGAAGVANPGFGGQDGGAAYRDPNPEESEGPYAVNERPRRRLTRGKRRRRKS